MSTLRLVPNTMTTENTNTNRVEIITKATATPWEIRRDLTLSDGDVIEDVRIVATIVEHFGQECEVTEWFADLNRFRGMTEDMLEEAMEVASDIMSAASYRLSNGGSVLRDGADDADHEARWDAEHAAVDAALDDLRKLDRNGAATLTDGTLDGYTAADKLEIIREAIASIKANA